MKRKIVLFVIAIVIIILLIIACIITLKKTFKTDVVIQNNNIKAEESITAIQNKAVPLSDIVFEISTDTGYSVEEMTLNFFETTIAFKINGEFPKEDELASFSVAQIENSTSFMSESNVPNISLTFKNITDEAKDLEISVTFINENKEEQIVETYVKVNVVPETIEESNENTQPEEETSEYENTNVTNNSSPDSSNSDSSSNQSSKTSHTHSWKDHTTKRWVSNMVTVVDTPAQTIAGAQLYTLHSDGNWYGDGKVYWFENGFTSDDLKAIIKDKIKNEGYIGNYVNRSKTIPATTYEEDHGHYENYVDYQYCDCGATR